MVRGCKQLRSSRSSNTPDIPLNLVPHTPQDLLPSTWYPNPDPTRPRPNPNPTQHQPDRQRPNKIETMMVVVREVWW